MSRKKKKDLPLLEKVEITGVAAEGKAIARVGDKVVFVPFAAPGDVVDVKLTRSRRKFMEGRIQQIHKLSADRVEPFCVHFGICGGCRWQHLPYETQLELKQQQVVDNMTRIGKISTVQCAIRPIERSEKTTFYRNKLEFTFSEKRWLTKEEIDSKAEVKDMHALGFHVPGRFDKVMDVEKCWLQPEPSNAIRQWLKSYAISSGLSFFNLSTNEGFLRNLIIRNTLKGELMVVVVFGEDNPKVIKVLLESLHSHFPEIQSLFYVVNAKQNSSLSDLNPILAKGKPFLEELMGTLRFRIGPKSFFQTNAVQAHKLYEIALDFAGLTGKETVYDLYTGAGTIACFISSAADKVIGVEYIEEAVVHARENAALNNITNTTFIAGDMARVFNTELMDRCGRPHVIITDPPRAGMHPDVIGRIIESGADTIVYVSCNPATQARDIQLLSASYRPVVMQAVDMFPQTHHVENVVKLERIRN